MYQFSHIEERLGFESVLWWRRNEVVVMGGGGPGSSGWVQTSLEVFGEEASSPGIRGDGEQVETQQQPLLSKATFDRKVVVHVGDLTPLVSYGDHSPFPTELVLAPVALHRRTIKRRLAAADTPRDTLSLVSPDAVAAQVVETATQTPPGLVDRVDRIALLEMLLRETPEATDRLQMVLGPHPAESVKLVDQARNELETITGYHPDRLTALREYCNGRDRPAATDMQDFVAGTVAIERALRVRTDRVTSTGALLRWACRRLVSQDGEPWDAEYASIERVWVCGISTLSASLVDFLVSLLVTTDVEVHLFLRRASAPVVQERLLDLFAIETPGLEVFDIR